MKRHLIAILGDVSDGRRDRDNPHNTPSQFRRRKYRQRLSAELVAAGHTTYVRSGSVSGLKHSFVQVQPFQPLQASMRSLWGP